MDQNLNIHKIQKGDLDEFEKLFRTLYPRLISLGIRFLPIYIVEDLVQDVFTGYWEEKENLELQKIESFFYKSLQNKCLNYIKHKQVEEKYVAIQKIAQERLNYFQQNTEESKLLRSINDQELKEQLELELEKLPKRMSEAFRLCYFEDLTHKEISDKMGISVRTVENHIYKVLEKIRGNIVSVSLLSYIFEITYFN